MKAQKDLKTINNSKSIESDELAKGHKLKPEKKEKNQKRSIFSEIEELDDPELQYKPDEDTLEDYLDDDDDLDDDDEDYDDDDDDEDYDDDEDEESDSPQTR